MLRLKSGKSPGRRRELPTLTITLEWPQMAFLGLMALALALRLWELDGRTMHYDEAIHLQAAWRLSEGHGFIHSPWMHGPFQVDLTALFIRVFGDTDFTARLAYVFFGTALVGIPYFLRERIGNAGALLTGTLLALSPVMLYFSRFGRNDIIMAFWASALLVLLWRYIEEGRNRYLFLAAAVLAFMFATKETAYFVTLFFGGVAFLLALPQLAPCFTRRTSLRGLAGPAGFFLLLCTLTLPQWGPLFGLLQGPLGLALVNPDGVSEGLVGAPQWEGPYLSIPLYQGQWWTHLIVAMLGVTALTWHSRRSGTPVKELPGSLGVPLALVAAVCFAVLLPFDAGTGDWQASVAAAGVLTAAAALTLYVSRNTWRGDPALLFLPPLLTAVYLALFTSALSVSGVVHWLLPPGTALGEIPNGIPLNFVAAVLVVGAALAGSAWLGIRWLGLAWLGLAGVFYGIWTLLYTTFFTNLAGVFSGVWQGMGYWMAQQEVARGDQPWYYYFVGVSIYEYLPAAFGITGAVYFLRRGDPLGLVMTLWALVTFLAYTVASEKMPWLLVNISLPLIFLSGAFLGRLLERVRWQEALNRAYTAQLVLWPGLLAGAVYLVYRWVDTESTWGNTEWLLLAACAAAGLVSAGLLQADPHRRGAALGGLGLAALLLGFSIWGGFRAAYTYDDSNVEVLVYAQGGSDLKTTYRELDLLSLRENLETQIVVDYDVWYPLQWYVRHLHDQKSLRFACFKSESDPAWTSDCKPVSESTEASARLLTTVHGDRDEADLEHFRRDGPLKSLLWFPESYRRPGENRAYEGSFLGFRGLPSKVQFTKDLRYFQSALSSRKSWSDGINYWLFRRLEDPWYDALYYSYLP